MEGMTGGLSSLLGRAKSFIQDAVQKQKQNIRLKKSLEDGTYQDAAILTPKVKKSPEKLIAEKFPKAKKFIMDYESKLDKNKRRTGKPHLEPYYDKIGDEWTVGYGRIIGINKAEQKRRGLSDEDIKRNYRMQTNLEAERDIDNQVFEAYNAVKKYENFLPEGMSFSDEQIETLIPFFQNTGVNSLDDTDALKEGLMKGDLSRFTLETFDADKGFTKATDKDNKTKKIAGLVNRRKDELQIIPGAFILPKPEVKKQMGGMVDRDPYKRQPRFI